MFSDDIPETWLCPKCITANTPEPPLYKLRPIVRRTLVTTNKGKNGLIELPYLDPSQQPPPPQQQMNINHHLLQHQHHSLAQPLPLPHSELHHLHHGHLDLHHIYATGGGNSNPNVNLGGLIPNHNDLHCDLYSDPYETMENEAKKVKSPRQVIVSQYTFLCISSVVFMQQCMHRMVIMIHLERQQIHHHR